MKKCWKRSLIRIRRNRAIGRRRSLQWSMLRGKSNRRMISIMRTMRPCSNKITRKGLELGEVLQIPWVGLLLHNRMKVFISHYWKPKINSNGKRKSGKPRTHNNRSNRRVKLLRTILKL